MSLHEMRKVEAMTPEQHAALLEGIRMGIEAAANEAQQWFPAGTVDTHPNGGVVGSIRALDPGAVLAGQGGMTMDVTQADRQIAAACIAQGVSQPPIQHILNGDKDEWFFVQAFAAHREAAVRDMRERAAKEAEDFWGVDTAADRIRALPLRSK